MTYQEQALEFLGIKRWHELGYTGRGIKILSLEKVTQKSFPNVVAPLGYDVKSGHGDIVMKHLQLITPEAEFISYPMSGTFSNNSYDCPCIDYLKENKVHIVTDSLLGGEVNTYKQKILQECIDNGTIFFIAAGNRGDNGLSEESKCDKFYSIGGFKPTFTGRYDKDNEPIYNFEKISRVNYSAIGQELDFVTLAEILGHNGTSFCSPVFASMCALTQQFFIEQAGRRLTREEMERFIKDNLIDLCEEGFDIRSGYGLFRLPNPSEINISKYIKTYIDYSGFPKIEGGNMKIQEMLLTPNEYSRCGRKIKPDAIAWHYVGNAGTSALANRNYFENLKNTHVTKASSHYIIGLEGEILHLIPDDEMSFCTNQANIHTISVECCHTNWEGEFTQATYDSMIWLGKYLMKKHNIKENIRHYDVTLKHCPKWFVDHPDEWEKFKNRLEEEVMLDKVMEKLGITEEELITALTDLVKHKVNKDERPDWLTDELYNSIKARNISDMTRLNDTATRAEVATMVYNSTKKGE